MMLKKTLMAALLVAAGTAFAADDGQSAQEKFQQLDQDSDQNISRSEAEQEQKILDAFAEIDQDQDGVLSQNELEEWKSQTKEEKKSEEQ